MEDCGEMVSEATVMDFCTLGILGRAPPWFWAGISPFLSGVSFIISICSMLWRREMPVRRSMLGINFMVDVNMSVWMKFNY